MEFDRLDCFAKISVRIPKSWVDTTPDDEEGTYVFYDADGDSGNLRVSLFTNERSRPYTLKMLQEEDFEYRDEEGVKFFVVDDEYTIAEWERPAHKEDETYIYWWTVSAVVGPQLTRRALFSYAVRPQLQAKPDFREHLKMVRDCVFATHFKVEQPN